MLGSDYSHVRYVVECLQDQGKIYRAGKGDNQEVLYALGGEPPKPQTKERGPYAIATKPVYGYRWFVEYR